MSALLMSRPCFAVAEEADAVVTEPLFDIVPKVTFLDPCEVPQHLPALVARSDDDVGASSVNMAEPTREAALDFSPLSLRDGYEDKSWDLEVAEQDFMSPTDPDDTAHAVPVTEPISSDHDCSAEAVSAEPVPLMTGSALDRAINLALAAQESQEWQEAYRCWHEVRLSHPEFAAAWAAEVAMLLILGRLDEAESLAKVGVSILPDSIEVRAQSAGVAIVREDWFGALSRIDDIEGDAPLDEPVASHIATMRRSVLAQICLLSTTDLRVRAAHLESLGNWRGAVCIWGILYDRDPRQIRTVIGYGQALREVGDYTGADRVLAVGLETVSDDQELHANYAQVPAARRDWGTAAQRWQRILRLFPDTPGLWSMAATAYREAGLVEPAELLLARAIALEPSRVDLHVQYALLAEGQEKWALAVERWDAAHRLWPDEPNIRNSRGDAIWQEASQRLEQGELTPVTGAPLPEAAGADMKHVALQFEGLGDNCEFGIVQRHFGADPIGLFRFAAISAETLSDLLHEEFDRLGDPAFTKLSLTAGDEFLVRDTRGLYHLHSFVRKGFVNEEAFLSKQVQRLAYLKRKLLEDLRENRKIFVHKSSLARIDDHTALRLHEAISAFGHNCLLVIRRTEADHPSGTLSVLRPGLLVGYVSTLYSGEGSPVDFESWRSLLMSAYEYRKRLTDTQQDAYMR